MSELRSLVIALAIVTSAISTGSAQVPLFDGFGGPRDYGTQCLGPNDDGSSRTVDLTPVFPSGLQFFDRNHTSMFVNTNGNITFSGALPQYTPDAFPVANQPMIAPFWADVDIREDFCSEDTDGGSGYAGDCENPSSNGVWWHVDAPGNRVVVTWDEVSYFRCTSSKRMSFQLILTPVPVSACAMAGDFDVEFRYNRCEWNTGDASGGESGLAPGTVDGVRRVACVTLPVIGETCAADPTAPCMGGFCNARATPAQAGFDAGNTTDFIEIPTSRSNEIHTTLCTMSNVGEPGIWRFQVRRGSVLCPDAGDACETGGLGVCGIGRTACVGGTTDCRQDVTSSEERCDALDNDCDGTTDEGDSLCGRAEVCDRGVCIESCFEFGCPAGYECDARGRCVENTCLDVTCPEGQRCRRGACVGACDGVVCPGDLTCVGGQCVDTCAGTECDDCTVCEGGACIERCVPGACGAGEECAEDGRCVDAGCAALTCPATEVCRAGACVDACSGAVCPIGEGCQMGACVDLCVGVDCMDGEICESGVCIPEGRVLDAGTRVDGGADFDGGPEFDGGPGFDAGGRREDPAGCACRVGVSPDGPPWAVLAMLAGMVRLRRRKARNSKR